MPLFHYSTVACCWRLPPRARPPIYLHDNRRAARRRVENARARRIASGRRVACCGAEWRLRDGLPPRLVVAAHVFIRAARYARVCLLAMLFLTTQRVISPFRRRWPRHRFSSSSAFCAVRQPPGAHTLTSRIEYRPCPFFLPRFRGLSLSRSSAACRLPALTRQITALAHKCGV